MKRLTSLSNSGYDNCCHVKYTLLMHFAVVLHYQILDRSHGSARHSRSPRVARVDRSDKAVVASSRRSPTPERRRRRSPSPKRRSSPSPKRRDRSRSRERRDRTRSRDRKVSVI